MKNKRKIFVIIAFTALIAAGCVIIAGQVLRNKRENPLETSIDYNVEKQVQPVIKGYQLIVSNPSKGVYVYGKKINNLPYFERVLIKTKTSQREFSWKATTKNPGLFVANLTNTKEDSIVLVFVTAYGTGLYESEIHVLNSSLTKEYIIERADLAAERLITARAQGNEIVFKSGGREFRVKPVLGPGGIGEAMKNLQYGSVVTYNVENNKIKAVVSVQINPLSFLGEFTIIYSYEGGKFVPQVTDFKKF